MLTKLVCIYTDYLVSCIDQLHYLLNHRASLDTYSTNHRSMNRIFYSFILILFFQASNLTAQCPGCIIDLPEDLAEDTLYVGELANGIANDSYDQDLSFRMPKTTTPVSEIDPTIPAGLDINQISVVNISNVPPGLTWESDQDSYNPQENPDGCLKFCGTPLVPGLYVMEVTVEATVVIINQQTSFPLEILIEPAVSNNDGFSINNNVGCGEVTVGFENNVPSNGDEGFTYLWDFGNGITSLDENPSNQTYNSPGTYLVNYQAVIDTSGYILTKVRVNDVGCDDIPTGPAWSNNPDMRLQILDQNGVEIYDTDPIDNTDPPVEFFPNLLLTEQIYTMKIIDNDSGINGGDDICIQTSFTIFSDGTMTGSDWELELEIFHPVDTISSLDSVIVYAIPEPPIIITQGATETCAGEAVVLTSSYDFNNQWLLNGMPIEDATEPTFEAEEFGDYQVVHTSDEGCSSTSEITSVLFLENPGTPTFLNENNYLSLLETIVFPSDFEFQWYQDGIPLAGETTSSFCTMESGNYTLEVTDPINGCTSSFSLEVTYDGSLDCFTSTADLINQYQLNIFPNPVNDQLTVQLETIETVDLQIRVIDLLGRQHGGIIEATTLGRDQIILDQVNDLLPGLYWLELQIEDQTIVQQFVKL